MERRGAWLDDMVTVLRDALLVAGLSCGVGLLVNLVHPEAIPFVADREYQIFAPCPEPGGEVSPVSADAAILWAEDTFVVDARSRREFEAWHFRRPTHVPYDYLDPTPADTLRHLVGTITRSRARRVVVYGDGDVPDSGEQLAKELADHGIRRVLFVQGGAPALRSSEAAGASR